MSKKRMRVFAGPNGSGKTTIINELKAKISFGVYVNADDIENAIRDKNEINLTDFKITSTTSEIQDFFKFRAFSPQKVNMPDLWCNFSVIENKLCVTPRVAIFSYIAADIAEYLREKLLESDTSFSYETVMSHEGKLSFLKKASENNYRVYLYFIATEDPEININRVNIRVALNGHAVDPDVIKRRYYKSLKNLKNAVKLTNRSYIFDNSGQFSVLIAEVTDGKDVKIIDTNVVPNWFKEYLAP